MAVDNTYQAIATQTLSSTATTVTFSSIPSTYTDLVFVVNASQGVNSSPVYLRVNGLTTSIYSNIYMWTSGTSVSAGKYNATALGGAGYLLDNYNGRPFPTDFSGVATYHFMNYSNTTTYKTVLIRHGASGYFTDASVALGQTTNAISSIDYYPYTGSFAIGSTFTLYGIKAA